MTGTRPPHDEHAGADRADETAAQAPPRRLPVFGPARATEPEPYPAASRPSFDIPVSAPVSAHAPVVLERISAPSARRAGKPAEAGDRESPAGYHLADRSDDTSAARPSGRRPSSRTSEDAAGSHSTTAVRHRRLRVAVIVLAFLLVGVLGAGAYLAVLSNEWEQRSGEWEAQSRDLGSDVAALTGDIAGMTSELTLVRDQLATAQTRITELADEKAQVGDDRESQKILADDVQEVAETALDVSAALGDCVTAQNAVIGYLAAPDTATPEVLQTAITQADTVCTAAVADYNSLQQDLADS